MPTRPVDSTSAIYLIGGGIASLAAAAFFIRDGRIMGKDITILEESGKIGGSLDAAGTPDHGYVMRGGRMIEINLYESELTAQCDISLRGGSAVVIPRLTAVLAKKRRAAMA